jgi:hypothetical protein
VAVERSEISSLSATLEQVISRLAVILDAEPNPKAQDRDEKARSELIAVERSLVAARRRLERLIAPLPPPASRS